MHSTADGQYQTVFGGELCSVFVSEREREKKTENL